METIVQVAQLVLALSILVGVHEGGHMVAAKAFGMKVEKFFIGFPPKLFSFKKGETEYGLGAVPLGGFVKISGMIDESLDKKQMSGEPQPWEFRSKPAWQRLIVMLGGIIVNVVTGVIAFVILTYNVGETYYSSDYAKNYGFVAGELAKEVGFRTGDKVMKVNGEDFERITAVWDPATLLASNAYWTVDRNGETIDIQIPDDFLNNLEADDFQEKFLTLRYPFMVTGLPKKSTLPLQEQDRIVRINGAEIIYYDQFKSIIASLADQRANFVIERDGEQLTYDLPVKADSTLGIFAGAILESSRDEYTFSEAIVRGTSKAFGMVVLNAKALGKMFSGDVSARSISGPIGIVNMFPKTWDWNRFWYSTGFISMILAFMNLLPIPALDGGHVVFLLFEMISGKVPSDKFLENAQKVGMFILLGLMVFVFGNDILKLFGL